MVLLLENSRVSKNFTNVLILKMISAPEVPELIQAGRGKLDVGTFGN
jgi:hypothetical protein